MIKLREYSLVIIQIIINILNLNLCRTLVVKIFKENLQKAFHRIIAPAEKYTIFKNKSKRKLTMDNTTMLGLLLQCTLVVSETG